MLNRFKAEISSSTIKLAHYACTEVEMKLLLGEKQLLLKKGYL